MPNDNPQPDANRCLECGATLPASLPKGLCPQCALRGALTLEAEEVAGPAPDRASEKPGDKVGRYKLLQQIGEGGCGVVYMAEQEEPVRRRVALKIIKLGMDTREVVARFEAERQALALMDHPNIARVFDGGATDTGRPYFVMELVRGEPITQYCDAHRLTTRERLELFMQVCQAVQHAHQKGIIHRDLKPSNVLVTELDGRPTPKVIDFGVAKATEQHLTEKTLFTRFGQMVGTPAYMSPEQAGFGGMDIDTRSDVYSLGVLLYELLTGGPPFDGKQLREAGFEAVLKTIREVEPPKPSTRLSTLSLQDLATVAGQRQVEPAKLNGLLRGELDWIVMKAMEKDRGRRYETANGLAADIQRHLGNEPVVALPPSQLYRFEKFVRRNKLAFAATTAVGVTLIVGLVVSTRLYLEERDMAHRAGVAEQKAQANQRKAEIESARSKQVSRFLQEMLQGVGPSVALGRDTTLLREILEKTAQRLTADLTNQPEVEAELRSILGSVYHELGQYTNSESMFRVTLELQKQVHGESSVEVANTLDHLAVVQFSLGRVTEAEKLFRETLALRRQLFPHDHPHIASSLDNIGNMLQYRGEVGEAEKFLREGLAVNKKWRGTNHINTAISAANLGSLLNRVGAWDRAEEATREALALFRNVVGEDDPQMLAVLSNLAYALQSQGKFEEAEELDRRVLNARRRVLGENHSDVALSLNNLGKVQMYAGKTAEAEQSHRDALAIFRDQLPADHPNIAMSLTHLALALANQKKLAEAEDLLREAHTIFKKAANPPDMAWSAETLADILLEAGKPADAEAFAREALAIRESTVPDMGVTFGARSWLGRCLAAQKKYQEAEPLLIQGYEGMKQRESAIHASGQTLLKDTVHTLVKLYEATNRPDQAAEWRLKLAEYERRE